MAFSETHVTQPISPTITAFTAFDNCCLSPDYFAIGRLPKFAKTKLFVNLFLIKGYSLLNFRSDELLKWVYVSAAIL